MADYKVREKLKIILTPDNPTIERDVKFLKIDSPEAAGEIQEVYDCYQEKKDADQCLKKLINKEYNVPIELDSSSSSTSRGPFIFGAGGEFSYFLFPSVNFDLGFGRIDGASQYGVVVQPGYGITGPRIGLSIFGIGGGKESGAGFSLEAEKILSGGPSSIGLGALLSFKEGKFVQLKWLRYLPLTESGEFIEMNQIILRIGIRTAFW